MYHFPTKTRVDLIYTCSGCKFFQPSLQLSCYKVNPPKDAKEAKDGKGVKPKGKASFRRGNKAKAKSKSMSARVAEAEPAAPRSPSAEPRPAADVPPPGAGEADLLPDAALLDPPGDSGNEVSCWFETRCTSPSRYVNIIAVIANLFFQRVQHSSTLTGSKIKTYHVGSVDAGAGIWVDVPWLQPHSIGDSSLLGASPGVFGFHLLQKALHGLVST